MLVLTRKEGEQIRIGNDIIVTVVRAGGDKIRLGIDAPPEMVILRSELQAVEPELSEMRKQGGVVSLDNVEMTTVKVSRCS